ncbi:monocarboxylate transporter 13-like [Tubulanus polymorphus]|uniref:monocarboxylate transporter 13-like n=1 Tax=Tubulanus polymorphus TaxID=672921 RepID=UPI003DA69A04
MLFSDLNTDAIIGWVVVFCTTLINIPVAGFLQSFGVFVKRFDDLFCPGDCLQLLGWMAALPYALNLLMTPIVIRTQKKMGDRWPFIIGILICTVSLVSTSYLHGLSWMFFTYCVLYGIGSSFVMYIPFGVIESYFPETHPHHVLATSFVTIGPPIGVLVVNPVAVYLDQHETADWRDTYRIFAVIIGVVGILPAIIMRRSGGKKQRDYEDLDGEASAQKKNPTCLENIGNYVNSLSGLTSPWILAILLISYGIFIPKIHFIKYMGTLGIDDKTASMVLSYEGIAETLATFVVSILGTLMSSKLLWFYIFGAGTLAVANGLLSLASQLYQVTIYCIVHGAMDGFLMTLTYPVISSVVEMNEHKPYVYGMTQFAIGMGQLIGLPMTGMMYDQLKSYRPTFIVASVLFLIALILIVIVFIGYLVKRRQQTTTSGADPESPTANTAPADAGEKQNDDIETNDQSQTDKTETDSVVTTLESES